MSTRVPLPAGIGSSRIVAIVRGSEARHLLDACRTLAGAGIRAIEVTTNTPGWEDVVRALADEPSVEVGAGTVLTPTDVERAVAAGARYVVAPDVAPDVGRAAAALGVAWIPGAFTPTEIRRAWEAGASAVKVFPAVNAGGPEYLRQVRAPLDAIPLLPTGGVTAEAIPAYLAAGAVAVGVGAPLIGDALASGDLQSLAHRAARIITAVGNA